MDDKDNEIKELKKRLDELENTNESNNTSPPAENQPSKSMGCFTWLLLIFAVFAVISIFSTKEDPKSPAEIQAEKNKGFHCLSDWDGSHSGLVRSVKATLRNPSSFDHVSTKIGPVNANGEHFISMTYRAENGFGGVNTEFASGTIKNSSCGLIEWK